MRRIWDHPADAVPARHGYIAAERLAEKAVIW
jgi:hypothetical protein